MALYLLLSWISILDFLRHRIPNVALVLLIFISMVQPHRNIYLVQGVLTLIIGLFIHIPLRIGAGDIKLATVLAFFYIPGALLGPYWQAVACISLFLMVLHLFIHRSYKGEIALAPALCAALLVT